MLNKGYKKTLYDVDILIYKLILDKYFNIKNQKLT